MTPAMVILADVVTLLFVAAMALVYDPASLDPLAPRLPLALIALPAALVATAGTRPSLALARADALVALALCLAAASAACAGTPWASTLALTHAALAAGAYLLGRRVGTRPALLAWIARGSLVGLVIFAVLLIGTFRQPAGADLTESVPTGALIGPLANPDYLAGWLVLTIPLASIGRAGRAFAALGIVALAWTLSRGGLLALAGAAALLARPDALPPRKPMALALVSLLVLVGFIQVTPSDRAKLSSFATFAKRRAIWQTATGLALEHPLFGHGAGSFPHVYEAARPEDPVTGGRMPPSDFAHDLPLQVAVEYGLAGLALLAAAIVGFIRVAQRLPDDPLARGLAVAVAAFLIHNLVSVTAYVLPVLLFAALVCGAAVTRLEPATPTSSRNACALTASLAALIMFLAAPYGLARNRALHDAGLAQTALASGNARAAIPLAVGALGEAPNHPHVRYLAAGALAEGGRPVAALAQYLLLEAQEPAFGQQAFNRARVLLDLERPAAALPLLERALTVEPESFPAWYAYAEGLYALGDRARCATATARARALAPTPELARKMDELAKIVADDSSIRP